jgi:hypothetical protein
MQLTLRMPPYLKANGVSASATAALGPAKLFDVRLVDSAVAQDFIANLLADLNLGIFAATRKTANCRRTADTIALVWNVA